MVFYFMKTIADWHVYINGIESFINSLLQRKANLLEYFFFWTDTLLSKYEGKQFAFKNENISTYIKDRPHTCVNF